MQQKVTTTQAQKIILSELDAIITFGNIHITTIASDLQRIKHLGDRKKLLLTLCIAIHSHASSMSYLLKDCRVLSSEVILRSILEGYVNTAFIIGSNNNMNSASYMLTEETTKLSNYHKMQKYRKDNPSYDTEQNLYTDADIQNGINHQVMVINEIKRKYPKAESVTLKTKISSIDDKFKQHYHNKPYRPMGWSYFHTYHMLCKSSHMTFDSLLSLFEKKDKELAFYMSGNPKRIILLAFSTYVFYLDMLNILLPRFGAKSNEQEELKKFDTTLERLKKDM